MNIATLTAKLEADIRDFERDMRTVNRRLDQVEGGAKRAGGAFKGMGKLIGGLGLAVAARKIGQFAAEVTMLAVDAEEAGSAFRTTFGPAVDDAQKFVDEFANKAGFAEHELQQLLATTGNVIQGLGGTEQASAALSEDMAILAGDVASFSNAAGGAPAVLKALQSALTGEREALKTYGIVVTEADVVERALLNTQKARADELTKLEKAQATVQIATERAGKAVGDLDRTQESAANSLRRLNAQWTETKTAIGAELLPLLVDFLPVLEELILSLGPKLVRSVQSSIKWLLAIGGIFDDDMRHMANLIGVQQQLSEEWLDGETAVRKFYVGMIELERVASLTEGNFWALSRSLNLNEQETLRSARAMKEYLEAAGTPTTGIDKWISELTNKMIDQERASGDVAEGWNGQIVVAKNLGKTVDKVAKSYDGMTASLRDVVSVMLAQTTPVLRAIDAYDNMNEVLNDVEASALDQAEAILEAGAAFGALTDGQIEGAVRAIATALGIADEEARALLVSAGLLDGKRIAMNLTIDYEYNQIGQIPNYIPEGSNPAASTIADMLPRGLNFAGGGVVPGPIGAPQLAVVHGGETITPPGGNESIVIELDGRQLWTAIKRHAVQDQTRNRTTGLN